MLLRCVAYAVFTIVIGFGNVTADIKNSVFIAGSGNPELASKISKELGVNLLDVTVDRFKNGETGVTLNERVRERDVFIISAFTARDGMSVNDLLIEFQLIADAARRSGAHRIFALLLNYPYARQDRRCDKRSPISASMVANMIENVGHVKRVYTVDLHSEQIQGFFQSTGLDNIGSAKLFADHIATLKLDSIVVVSPDAGGARRAEVFKDYLARKNIQSDFAMMIKKRLKANEVESVQLVGDVEGKTAIIVDDMCDTGGTLVAAAAELKKKGAKAVYACITHPIFSGEAIQKINASEFVKVFVTDSLPLKDTSSPKIEVLSLTKTLAEVIKRVLNGNSLSEIFPAT